MKQKLLLRIDGELKERLKDISQKEHRSLTSQIIKILADYCENFGGKNNELPD